MNKDKYELLKLIDKSDYGADNIDMIQHLQSAKHFQELFDDNLVAEIKDQNNVTRYVLTPQGREKLEEEDRFQQTQKKSNLAIGISLAAIILPLLKSLFL